MKKRNFFVAAAALALLATACSKEKDEMAAPQTEKHSIPITLTANYGNGSKVSYTDDGSGNVTATWDAGDKIIVCYDGETSELRLQSGSTTATATFSGSINYSGDHAPEATTLLVCYVKDANVTNSEVTVDGTGTYHYTDNVFKGQDGTLGGAAKLNLYYGAAFYGEGNITCNFSVNTSLMKFTLTNIGGDQGRAATLAYMSGSTEMAKASFTVANSGNNTVWLSIPASAYSGEQKLVYTCGGNTKEHVLSADHANFVAGKTYSKSVSVAPEGAISGLFTVSPNKQVYFSKGNLQYKNNTGWRFADNQYDYCQTSNGTWSTSGWVDLFGWGTWTGNSYNPLNVSTDDSDYDWNNDFQGMIAGASGTWRTLTTNEWDTLLTKRSTTSGVRYAKAKVNGVNGLIILPDDWSTTYYTLDSPNTTGAAYTTNNNISSDTWTNSFEAHGAVFLPAAGFRDGSDVSLVGSSGAYWSSSANGASSAWDMSFYAGNVNPQGSYGRGGGLSVRLVQEY